MIFKTGAGALDPEGLLFQNQLNRHHPSPLGDIQLLGLALSNLLLHYLRENNTSLVSQRNFDSPAFCQTMHGVSAVRALRNIANHAVATVLPAAGYHPHFFLLTKILSEALLSPSSTFARLKNSAFVLPFAQYKNHKTKSPKRNLASSQLQWQGQYSYPLPAPSCRIYTNMSTHIPILVTAFHTPPPWPVAVVELNSTVTSTSTSPAVLAAANLSPPAHPLSSTSLSSSTNITISITTSTTAT